MGKKLSDDDRRYIRENWGGMTCNEIGMALGFHKSTILRAGQKMGLGSKARADDVAKGRAVKEKAGKVAGSQAPDFFGMVAAVVDDLTQQRADLLAKLDQLATLPNDGQGLVAAEIAGTQKQLTDVEGHLIKAEEQAEKADHYRPRKPGDDDQIQNPDDLFAYLMTKESREKDGRLAEKLKMGGELVRQEIVLRFFCK